MSNNERPQITYYGDEVDVLLRRGRKIVTLRRPAEKYDIPAGQRVEALTPDAPTVRQSLVVVANDTRSLEDFPNATLLLDGYPAPEVAADDLARYYGKVTVETPMQRVATLPESLWTSLSADEQAQLLELGLDAAVKIPAFRRIFLLAMAFWFSSFGNATIGEWNKWSVREGLVTEREIRAKQTVDEATRRLTNMTLNYLVGDRLESPPDDPIYRSVVLHEAVSYIR